MKVNFLDNIMLLTDSYKPSHWFQYPPKTTKIRSYFESRGGEYEKTVMSGLQYLMKNYLEGEVITKAKIDEAISYYDEHLGPGIFNAEGWLNILRKHKGRLPVSIKAVPEGTVLPVRNVMLTIENTDPEFPWLTNYLETLLSHVWYSSTTATISREMKKIIFTALEKSGDVGLIDYKLHDFGCRGVSSMETAATGGFAHLINFKGTDTVPALVLARTFYGCRMAGHSIPAAEHSTITTWKRSEEGKAYANMLEKFPTGLVAVVSDSWNIYNAVKNIWGGSLKTQVLGREGTLVIRPDSGDPEVVVPEVLDLLGKRFEYATNNKGYKVLDPHVRVIQGDGINRHSLKGILDAVMARGWSADNVAFGSGGGLLQDCNRDTQKFAFKCSSAVVDGEEIDVFKEPITDSGKNSKRGRLALVKHPMFKTVHGNEWATVNEDDLRFGFGNWKNELVEVFRDGVILKEYTLDQLRERAAL